MKDITMNLQKQFKDLLRETEKVTEEQWLQALQKQKETGVPLGKFLVSMGNITAEELWEIWESRLNFLRINLSVTHISRDVADLLPVSLVAKYHVVPVAKYNRKLTLAMADPTDFCAIDDVQMTTGMEVEPVLALEKNILQTISRLYGKEALLANSLVEWKGKNNKQIDLDEELAKDESIISIVDAMIKQALKDRASDIHIEPQANNVRIRYRVDGVLREVSHFPRRIHAALLSRIKIMSDMDIAEKRLPQDGRAKFGERNQEVDLRVSTLPTILGEKAVLRILNQKSIVFDMEKLGFSEVNIRRYLQLTCQTRGMILITGPTGSGKTTTLYSTLQSVNRPERNIITLEDPVEYRLDGVNQVQVNNKAGVTFANGLRSILRQDPNIILVGEIRDTETANMAIRAALTGHLVFSTLHTNDASGAITRLVDMKVEPFLVASALLGVVAQRLVRVICPYCKISYQLEPSDPKRIFMGMKEEVTLYRGSGCSHCAYTGYIGRMSIHEVLPITSEVRKLIHGQRSSDELTKQAISEGMVTMKEDGVSKACKGLTTMEEVMRVAYSDESGGRVW